MYFLFKTNVKLEKNGVVLSFWVIASVCCQELLVWDFYIQIDTMSIDTLFCYKIKKLFLLSDLEYNLHANLIIVELK